MCPSAQTKITGGEWRRRQVTTPRDLLLRPTRAVVREALFNILGDAVLPIAEIDFGHMPKGMWRIVTYRSKWEDGCDEDLGSAPRCPARLPASVASQLRRIAIAAWRIAGGSGYGRVDMRIDERGRPWILEVNANPDIAPDAGLARMARVAGIERRHTRQPLRERPSVSRGHATVRPL